MGALLGRLKILGLLLMCVLFVALPVKGEPVPTCATCRQPIQGRYLKFGNRLYHPLHFQCAYCQKPIGTAPFVPRDGKPFHAECLAEAYHLTCGVCGKPIVEGGIRVEGILYHASCYQNTLAEKCAVCGAGIVGSYFVDAWGNKYHAAHQRQMPTCDYCSRIISPRTTGGGYTYQDGRNVCAMCYKSQIAGDRNAKPIVETVRSRLGEWGLEVPDASAPVILVDRGTLRSLLRRTGYPGGPNVNGFTSVLTERQGSRIVKREMAVYLLYGMPREIFAGTVAHELTHVWINLHNGRSLDPAFEEGSCNFFKFLYHQGSDSELAPYALKAMQQDQDPYYGVGFRRVKSLVDRRGLPNLITLLGRSTGFPLGY